MGGLSGTGGWMPSEYLTPCVKGTWVLTGEGYSQIEHIWQMSWRTSFYRGGPVFMSALAGIDIALWDLKGWSVCVRRNGCC